MADPLRLLFVLAHPDDESLGAGGVLAKYSAEEVETFLITATQASIGERLGKRFSATPRSFTRLTSFVRFLKRFTNTFGGREAFVGC